MRLCADNVSWQTAGYLIIDGISVDVAPGEVLGLLGPNGSGKSTLLRALSSILVPSSGRVILDGREIATWNHRELARCMSVVQQQVSTEQDITVREAIDLGRIPHRGRWAAVSSTDRGIVEAAAERTRVGGLLDRHWRTLSGGEQQRVQLARAFAQQGQVMLLDEPTNHLDVAHQLEVLATVRETGMTVVVALHDLNLAASFCDRVVVLSHGRAICQGEPHEVLTAELIREVYGVEVRVLFPAPGEAPLFQFLRSIR